MSSQVSRIPTIFCDRCGTLLVLRTDGEMSYNMCKNQFCKSFYPVNSGKLRTIVHEDFEDIIMEERIKAALRDDTVHEELATCPGCSQKSGKSTRQKIIMNLKHRIPYHVCTECKIVYKMASK